MATFDPFLVRGAADEIARLAAANAQLVEREKTALKRAAELTEINRLLVTSTLTFSSGTDPEAFLESLIRTLADSIGASPMALFEYDAGAETLTLQILYQNGILRRGPSGAEVPLYAAAFPADITPGWAESARGGGRLYSRSLNPDLPPYSWPGLPEWFERIGTSDAALMVLLDGDRPLGAFGLAWTNGRKLQRADCPFIEALGQQAGAALRLVKLADRTRDAAIAREREEAARERAVELRWANDSLQRSMAMLIREGETTKFLETVVRDAAAACGAMGAGVMSFDAVADTLQLAVWVSQDKRLDLPSDPRMVMWRRAYPASTAPGWLLTIKDDVLWFETDDENSRRWPEAQVWHLAMGHRMVAIIPLVVTGQPLGFLGLCFGEPVSPTQTRLDQARTLAGHAALALQLTRLTEGVRREATLAAALGERNRIARDLHDTLAQGFTGILAQLGVVEGALAAPGRSGDDDEVRHALGRAVELARGSLVEARRSVGVMRGEPDPPPDGAGLPLGVALRGLLDRMTAGTRLAGTLETAPAVPPLLPPVAETLRRIAQEALTNTLKHAGPRASEFRLRLGGGERRVHLVARDNGCGFDPDATNGDGFGLIGMRERATLIGGSLTVRSAHGEGVEIIVELPLGAPGKA